MDLYGSAGIAQQNSFSQGIRDINQSISNANHAVADSLAELMQQQDAEETEKHAIQGYKIAQAANSIKAGRRQYNLAKAVDRVPGVPALADIGVSETRSPLMLEDRASTASSYAGPTSRTPQMEPEPEPEPFRDESVADLDEAIEVEDEGGAVAMSESRARLGQQFARGAEEVPTEVLREPSRYAAGVDYARPRGGMSAAERAAEAAWTTPGYTTQSRLGQFFGLPHEEPEWGSPPARIAATGGREATELTDVADFSRRSFHIPEGGGSFILPRPVDDPGNILTAVGEGTPEDFVTAGARGAEEAAVDMSSEAVWARQVAGHAAREARRAGRSVFRAFAEDRLGWEPEEMAEPLMRASQASTAASTESAASTAASAASRAVSSGEEAVEGAGRVAAAGGEGGVRGGVRAASRFIPRIAESGGWVYARGIGGALSAGLDIAKDYEKIKEEGFVKGMITDNPFENLGNVMNIAGSTLEVAGLAGIWNPLGAATEVVGAGLALTGSAMELIAEEVEGDDSAEKAAQDKIRGQAQGEAVAQRQTPDAGRGN